ncbi:MAG: helicase-related protein [Candidatus Hydrogenedentales bacterium]
MNPGWIRPWCSCGPSTAPTAPPAPSRKPGFKAKAIHGGRTQSQRDQAIDGFRKGRYKVLVATDVAARGLDVEGISHVVNFDIPNSPEDYIHRIGRTARAKASGDAITFVCPDEFLALSEIETALGKNLPREEWEGRRPRGVAVQRR